MRSDDLVPLLAPPKGGGVGFRQGVVLTWNGLTAENTVLVGGTTMTNLPILNTSEALLLAEGDVVSILTSGATWAILGRMTIPGTPEAASSLTSLKTASATVSTGETTTSGTYTDLATAGPEVTVNIGSSGRCLVMIGAIIEGTAPRGSAIQYGGSEMTYQMSGANTLAASSNTFNAARAMIGYESASSFGADLVMLSGCSRVSLQTGLNPGDTTFTAKYKMNIGTISRFSGRNITVMVL